MFACFTFLFVKELLLRKFGVKAVQKFTKLSETPATAPLIANLCMNYTKNREIAEKLVKPFPLHICWYREEWWGWIEEKSILGDNFWLDHPRDLGSMPLCYIFYALFRDTLFRRDPHTQPNIQIAKYLDIWLLWYLAAFDRHGDLGCPWKEHWKCSSEALAIGI